jgi:hypothetical protein
LPTATGNTANGYVAGNYLLTITDDNNCTLVDSFEIEEPSLWSALLVSLSGTDICEGDTARVVPIDNYSAYLWNTGDTTQTLFVTQSGFYNCTVTDGNGCTIPGVGVNINFFQNYLNPEILLDGDSLYISEGTVTAWFNNGVVVPNATDNYILNPAPGGYLAQVVDSNGCTYLAKAYTITGIAESVWLNQVKVYPNPANNLLSIEGIPAGSQVMLMDVMGREISAADATGTLQLEVGHLPAQLYLLHVVSGENRYICKVFISR